MAMLTRLAEIGMGIAEDAGRRSAALVQGGEAGEPDAALAYARAARAVRLTIALQSRLLNDLAALDRDDHLAETSRVAKRRNRIHRVVERAIEAAHDDEEEVERLSMDAWERLTDEDDADLAGRPFDEVVARICEDLGLSPECSAQALAALGGGAEISLPFMGRVAAKPSGGAILWNGGLDPIPPPAPRGAHPP